MKIDYTRFAWFDLDTIERVIDVLKDNPETGRPTLSKQTGLSMFKCEKVLEVWRDHDLYQHLDAEDPLTMIVDALALEDDAEEGEPYDPREDFVAQPDRHGEKRFDPDGDYIYNVEQDRYTVMLNLGRDSEKVVVVPGETHRAMRKAYSDWDGNRQTLNQIAKEFGVSRKWFYAYKTSMGWTHDQDPFTDQEILESDEDELARRAVQHKRHAVEQKYHQAQHDQDRKDAERYRKLDALVLEPLAKSLSGSLPRLEVPRLSLTRPREPFAAVISPMDLHYGKIGRAGFVDDPYDRAEAEKRLVTATESLLEDVTLFGEPEEIIVGMGSDWLHIDNIWSGTTSNRHALDVDGHVWEVIEGASNLAYQFFCMLKQVVGRIRVVMVAGNHDKFATMWLLKFLQASFANDERIEFVTDLRERTYIDYGTTLMGFTHGDNWTMSRTPKKILTEPPRSMLAGTVDRVWFTGHKHHESYKNDDGVFWYQLPSLSGDDQWHDDKGWTGARKSLSSFIIRRETGIVGNLLAPHRHD